MLDLIAQGSEPAGGAPTQDLVWGAAVAGALTLLALWVCFAHRTGRFGLLRLTIRALFGRLRQDKDFNALCATELWIDAPAPHLSVAIDGEVHRFTPPLHYKIRPRALNVILPHNT